MIGGPFSCGLYIHIPFCLRKCSYCDFVSYPVAPFDTARYCAAVVKEIEMALEGDGWPEEVASCLAGASGSGALTPRTAYIGGGTPTVLPISELEAVVTAAIDLCGRGAAGSGGIFEFTVEANPCTLSSYKACKLRDAGVNRISLGLQSTSDQYLTILGRAHSYSEFLAAYRSAVSAGFSNISVDLIYGLPGQTREDWRRDLQRTADLAPQHISCYALTLADGTALARSVHSGQLPQISDDLAADMYFDAASILSEAGYSHYEISNYAKPGMECRHNQNYWENGYYFGIGAAAHSHLPGMRCENVPDVAQYIECVEQGRRPLANVEWLTPEREVSDAFILGLRTSRGVDTSALAKTYGAGLVGEYAERLEKLRETGLVEFDGQRVRLTEGGMILSNRVMMELL
ncbi:MAG: radical SAM family heme chaperone HemW [Firmicutes bacterium]|nr:radical SAM family heme chaperone HemW [Bacillota bacterium]